MLQNSLKERLILGPSRTPPMALGIYVLLWLIIALFPLMVAGSTVPHKLPLGVAYAHLAPFLAAFLWNHYILVPRLLLQNHWRSYILWVSFCVVIVVLAKGAIHGVFLQFQPDYQFPIPLHFIVVGNAIAAYMFIGFDTAISVSGKWIRDSQHHQKIERENLASQIAVLQHQISPHFFMNTLNNIHALVDLDPERAKESCIRLSRMMRYMLYDSHNGLTSLTREIDFIASFLDLMRLRYDDKVVIEFDYPEHAPSGAIPSFLFLPFIENAFKHGIRHREESYIKAKMALVGERIHFDCTNSVAHAKTKNLEKSSGIGLTNLQQRLVLLYGENHALNTTQSGTSFQVHMEIPCP